MAQDTLDYRVIIHKLTAPKCFIDYVHNFEYSFEWKCSECDPVSTDSFSFDHKTCTIDFNRTKLKLRFDELQKTCNDHEEYEYNSTKLILREKQMNRKNASMVNLDEITLTANYFVINKRQQTNITFNKVIANNIRIELRLSVTLIAKPIYGITRRVSNTNSLNESISRKEADEQKEKEEVILKWLNNRMKMDDSSSKGEGGYSSSVCSDSKKRRSGLCANSVAQFYQKSKQIEEEKREENKLIDEQIKNDYNEMGNKLMINMEESQHLKSQISVLQNLLFEKNVEIEELKQNNIENRQQMRALQTETQKYKSNEFEYLEKLNENKILIQTMKYELQCRYSKYNQLLNVMKIKKKSGLKAHVAQLLVDNDDLEYEITRIAHSWRDTSHLMENYANIQIRKYKKVKRLYRQQLKENQKWKDLLIKHGIVKEEEEDEHEETPDIEDMMENDIRSHDEDTEDGMSVLWDDNAADA
eukprot:246993_1